MTIKREPLSGLMGTVAWGLDTSRTPDKDKFRITTLPLEKATMVLDLPVLVWQSVKLGAH